VGIIMASSNFRTGRLALVVCGASLAWLATGQTAARADHDARSAFPTSPLTAALSQASNDSGIPVPTNNARGAGAAASPRVLPDAAPATPRPPSEQELAGDSLYQFIVHHATVHYVNTGATGNLAYWRGGRPETICPATLGLDPASNAFVTARIRAVAAAVGAPVASSPSCQDNVRVFFTNDPDSIMASVVSWSARYFGVRYPAMRRLMMFRSGEPVQGWYFTTRGNGRVLNLDVASLDSVQVLPLWPQVIPTGLTDNGSTSGIVSVILIVDPARVAGSDIGATADYLAMLALSVVQSPDHCDALPSILDLLAPSCGARTRPAGLTAGDLAFLKALYFHDTGLGPSLTRIEVQGNMLQQFKKL
jgi:hypothetical protein